MGSRTFVITNDFDFFEIKDGDPKFELFCENKFLVFQNDINMKHDIVSKEDWLKFNEFCKIIDPINTILHNYIHNRYGLFNPLIEEFVKSLQNIKLYTNNDNAKELLNDFPLLASIIDEISIFFNQMPLGEQFCLELDDVSKRNVLIDIQNRLILINNQIKEDLTKKIAHNKVIHKEIKSLFRDYNGFQNISLLSSLEALLDPEDKEKYPLSITNTPKILNAISRKEAFIQNEILNNYLKENEASKEIDEYAHNRVAEYHIYNLLTFSIVFDFLLKFKSKNLQNISELDLIDFLNSQKTLTIPALFIIDVLINWNSYVRKENQYITQSEIKDLKFEGFDSKGILPNFRKYKNTIFDLSEIIMSHLIFPVLEYKSVFLTEDRGCILFMKMYKIKIENNKIRIKPTNYLNTIQDKYNYESIFNYFEEEINLFENKILLKTKSRNNLFNIANVKDFFSVKIKENGIKLMLEELSCLGNTEEICKTMWEAILEEDGTIETIEKMYNIFYILQNKDICKIVPLTVIKENIDVMNQEVDGFNGSIMHKLAEEVELKKQKLGVI